MQAEPVSIIITVVIAIVVPIFFYFIFRKELKPFKRLADIATVIFDESDEYDKEKISGIVDDLSTLGRAASNVNEVLSSEEAFDGFMTILANKIRKSFVAGLLGGASGDSKRMAKADKLVNKAMIDGLAQMNPMIGAAAQAMGLNEIIEEDPEMFDAILKVIFNKGGLIEMFKTQNPSLAGLGDSSSLATPKDGIDF